jgi:hypothetical protein
MPTGMYLVGGSKGRPTGPELRGCQVNSSSTWGGHISPCAPVIKTWQMIKTNDWYYKPGSGSSTTGGASTGGNMGAKKRRT